MRKIVIAAAFAAFASTASAGNLSDASVEPTVTEKTMMESTGSLRVPLILLGTVIVGIIAG